MSNRTIKPQCLCLLWFLLVSCEPPVVDTGADVEVRVSALLERMTPAEKIGQMSQINGAAGKIPADLHETVKQGRIGSILNEVEVDVVNGLQRIAVEESRLGVESPSGKLPVTFPKMVGQVPIYYAHKQPGRPATPETFVHIDDIPVRQPQYSTGFVSNHLDAGYKPQYPFGYGLSYGRFVYSGIEVSDTEITLDDSLTVRAVVRNAGKVEAEEVVQLYVRDLVGQVTRPVRELKGFRRVRLAPGESRSVSFELNARDFAFFGRDMRLVTEPGEFHAWIGGSSDADLRTEFSIVEPDETSAVE